MGQIRLHPDAEEEFMEAISFYESRREGLGLQFRNEVLR